MEDIKRKDLFGKTDELILVLLRSPKGLKSIHINTLFNVMLYFIHLKIFIFKKSNNK